MNIMTCGTKDRENKLLYCKRYESFRPLVLTQIGKVSHQPPTPATHQSIKIVKLHSNLHTQLNSVGWRKS